MNWNWLCKIGLHKWVVVKEYYFDYDKHDGVVRVYRDKVCIRDDCGAYVLEVDRRLDFEEKLRMKERERDKQWHETAVKKADIERKALSKLKTLVPTYK